MAGFFGILRRLWLRDAPIVFDVTGRVLVVAQENRVIGVAAEARALTVGRESRVAAIADEGRALAVPRETRTVIVSKDGR